MGFSTCMGIYLMLLVGSQIYLGVSTSDQAMFSLAFGFVCAFGMHHTMRRNYLTLIERLKKTDSLDFSDKKVK